MDQLSQSGRSIVRKHRQVRHQVQNRKQADLLQRYNHSQQHHMLRVDDQIASQAYEEHVYAPGEPHPVYMVNDAVPLGFWM